jgi:hypothetical protein
VHDSICRRWRSPLHKKIVNAIREYRNQNSGADYESGEGRQGDLLAL